MTLDEAMAVRAPMREHGTKTGKSNYRVAPSTSNGRKSSQIKPVCLIFFTGAECGLSIRAGSMGLLRRIYMD
jgi:hypothetical protein